MTLPTDHPLRHDLNDEVHARPPVPLEAPQRISYLVLISDAAQHEAQWRLVCDLVRMNGKEPPASRSSHLLLDLGAFRFKMERHTEFTRFKFILPGVEVTPFAEPAIAAVPADWLAKLPGHVIVATHVSLVSAASVPEDPEALSKLCFDGNVLAGSSVSDGAAAAVTDFRIHADGFGRILVRDRNTTPRQAGRIVTRLLEIDTYRMMALLAFPVARGLSPTLSEREKELAEVSRAMAGAGDGAAAPETHLLQRLMRLEAEIESRYAETQYRFRAAAAYYELVERRIDELRETRLPGMQTLAEFMERRLAPAMATVSSTVTRLDALSERVSRATQLLSTRVDVAREAQNQSVLATMARRAKMQLRLQQTVEGLSVAAISYYIVGLVGYAAKGLKAVGMPMNTDVVTALAIPVVIGLVTFGVRRLRRVLGVERPS